MEGKENFSDIAGEIVLLLVKITTFESKIS